ncbi:hypothetical protein NRZ30_15710 [Aeromonas jandaei]|uniref:hypothetical protein n=1 Tax=Aeromonas jandaei TaxID=650 RepID=UPI00227B5AD9|nr:hypothetical protein [Aeromonas jandaei]WAG06507.1 hypothetical protein NRZ30_15710 [Aeromonas jandaei]
MDPVIKIIHQLSQNYIFERVLKTETDLKAWLANGYYLINNPLKAFDKGKAKEFELVFQQTEHLYAALANDCNRFAQAAIESMWCVGQIDKLPKSTGWATVQMYYSAFFAVHAILRIFGRACTQLEDSHVRKVIQIASATNMGGDATKIESGFYISIINGSKIEYKKLQDSHADTWWSFSNLLTWILNELPNTTGLGEHKVKAAELISDIKSAISKSGASKGNWPSQIRNKINYQHSHGVWYPYKSALHVHEQILRNAEWLKNPESFDLNVRTNDVQFLFNLTNSILSLMYQLLKYGYERAGKVSDPLTNGAFRLLNQIQT